MAIAIFADISQMNKLITLSIKGSLAHDSIHKSINFVIYTKATAITKKHSKLITDMKKK